jgi:hypothetical protein
MGLIGPAGNASHELEQALELLWADESVRRIVYLGADGALDALAAKWNHQEPENETFLARAAELACNGTADEITTLLAEESPGRAIDLVRKLPEAPARAIEMLDKWIVLAVYDKAVLDEDDIANAHVVVYGRSDEALLKRFGPRCFFTPGPLSQGKLGSLTLQTDGQLELRLLALDGTTLSQESLLQVTSAKLVVTP